MPKNSIPIPLVHRPATAPTWGGLRDAALGIVTTSVGAYVLTRTGSPELANASQDFVFQSGNVVLGLSVGLGVFGRKMLSEWLANR